MSEQTLSLNVDYTADDMAAELTYWLDHGRGFVVRRFDGWVPLVIETVASVWIGLIWSPYAGALVFLGLPLFVYAGRPRMLRRLTAMARSSPLEFGARRIDISSAGLVIERPDGRESHAWGGVGSIAETKQHIFVRADAKRSIVGIPKRAFESPEAADRALVLLKNLKRDFPKHRLLSAAISPLASVEFRLRAREVFPFGWICDLIRPTAFLFAAGVLGIAAGVALNRIRTDGTGWPAPDVLAVGLAGAIAFGLVGAAGRRLVRLRLSRPFGGWYRTSITEPGIVLERPFSSQLRPWSQVALPKRGRNTAICVPGYPDVPLVSRAFASQADRERFIGLIESQTGKPRG